jgi:hypothetical protein
MQNKKTFIKYLAGGVLTSSLAALYLFSMAPGLTWANYGADGGDLITAAATNGVAHPTGYPLYLLLARIFQSLPIGTLAYRTSLMSAVAAVLSAIIIYVLMLRGEKTRITPALLSAYAFGLSPLFWSQAVITEVYTLHILFIVILLFLSTEDSYNRYPPKKLNAALGLAFGLGIGNHVTMIFTLPFLFRAQERMNRSVLLQRFTWAAIGLLPYLTLPLKAMFKPPVNWGNPITVSNFAWLVTGKLYQEQFFEIQPQNIIADVQSAAALLLDQFGFIGLILGLMGLVTFHQPTSLQKSTVWIFIPFTVFAVTYGTRDAFIHLLPAFLCFSIWIGIGADGLIHQAEQKFPRASLTLGGLLLAYFFMQAIYLLPHVDASQDVRAEEFGKAALTQIPQDALVFAKGDETVFALWYFHYALHQRPDITVIATDLLPDRWYQDVIRSQYPNLSLPDFFMFPEVVAANNPDKPVCHIRYTPLEKVTCTQP